MKAAAAASPLALAFASVLALTLLVSTASAAPATSNNSQAQAAQNNGLHLGQQIHDIWSAFELWLYRLLHGGRNPPGWDGASSSSSAVRSSTLVASSTTSIVPTSTTAITSVPVSVSTSVASAASSSEVAPSSTSSAAGPVRTAPLGASVCAVQPPSFYAPSCSIGPQADTCCNLEQGHLLVTFFWNAGSGSSGPADSFTGHGTWPDRCDGTYDSYCDPSTAVSYEPGTVVKLLQDNGRTELLNYMNQMWLGNNGNEDLWAHEQAKHGTCISTLKPSCFTNYYPQAEAVTYFEKSVEFFKALPSYAWLAEAGIVPSVEKTYTLAEITAVLESKHGGGVNVNCGKGGVLNELWFHYASRGSFIDGDIVPVPLVGSGSTCPATGIKYYPKYVTIPSTTTSVSGSSPSASASVPKGFVYGVLADGTTPAKTCVISGGTLYYGGSCAGFTLGQVQGGAVTLSSSKGLCAVDATTGVFGCSAAVTQGSEFVMADDGTLNLGGSTAFSVDSLPSGSVQIPIAKGSARAIPLTLKYIAN